MAPPPPRSTLFPYTTLFRSQPRSLATPRNDPLAVPTSRIRPRSGAARSIVSRHFAKVRSRAAPDRGRIRSEEHTSELQSRGHLVCRLLLEKKKPTATPPSPK